MPDSLDPTSAIFEGLTSSITRFGLFFLATGGSAALGMNIHQITSLTLSANPWSSLLDMVSQATRGLPLMWLKMMASSVATWWLAPFLVCWLFLAVLLWRGRDLFLVLFILVLTHSLHAFLYVFSRASYTSGQKEAICIAMLICEGSLAALMIWWRRVSNEAPESEPTDPEPEL